MMEIALSRTPGSYYRSMQAIGASQDFITAPEISQMFGEMIAVWTTLQWQSLGFGEINIVELRQIIDQLLALQGASWCESVARVTISPNCFVGQLDAPTYVRRFFIFPRVHESQFGSVGVCVS
jgi:hypothetical protein